MFINDSRKMQILVRINAAYDATTASSSQFFCHTASLRLPMGMGDLTNIEYLDKTVK